MPFENIGINLQINADTSQAKQQLQSLQNTLQSINKNPLRFGQTMTQEVQKASQAAAQLQQHLQNATNVNTGTLDFGKFSQSLQKSGHDLDYYGQQLKKLGPEGYQAFQQLGQNVASAEVPIRRSSELLTKMGTTLKNTIRWQISSQVIRGFQSSIQGAFNYAEKLNKSLNNIRIVTGYSTDQMAQFATEANKAARALSTTTTAYTDASLIFYQQGLKGSDVTDRANTVIKLANVTRQSAQEVSDQMTAVWNNFYDGSKSLESYADTLTALGAATASSSAEISQGLEKFAAVARTTGLSYEYATTALATVVAQTRQSADVVGTSFKTLLARLQDLEQGNTLDDGTTLGQYSEALMKVGINIKDQTGQLKQADQILNDMGAKWKSLGQDQKVALAQNVAGVRQYTQLVALMDNWDKFQQNLTVAQGSAGTLQKQADVYAESWEAARKRVQASLETVYSELVNDKFFIKLNNAAAKTVNLFGEIIKGAGGLKGVLATIGALATTVFDKQISKGLDTAIYNMKMLTTAGRQSMQQEKLAEMEKIGNQLSGSDFKSQEFYNETYAKRIELQKQIVELTGKAKANEAEIIQINAQKINQDIDSANELAKQTEELIRQKELKEDALLDAYNGDYDTWKENQMGREEVEAFAEAQYELQEMYNLAGGTEAKTVEKYQTAVDNFKASIETIDPSKVKDVEFYVDQIKERGKGATEAFKELQQIYEEIFRVSQRERTRNLNKDLAPNERMTAAQKASFGEVNRNKIEIAVNEKRQVKALENINTQIKDVGKSTEEVNYKTVTWGETLTGLTRVISSINMVTNAFQSLKDTIKDPDLSGWEKFTKVLTSLSSAMMGLMFLFKGTDFNRVFGKIGETGQQRGQKIKDKLRGNKNKVAEKNQSEDNNELSQDTKETLKNKKASEELGRTKDKETKEINDNAKALDKETNALIKNRKEKEKKVNKQTGETTEEEIARKKRYAEADEQTKYQYDELGKKGVHANKGFAMIDAGYTVKPATPKTARTGNQTSVLFSPDGANLSRTAGEAAYIKNINNGTIALKEQSAALDENTVKGKQNAQEKINEATANDKAEKETREHTQVTEADTGAISQNTTATQSNINAKRLGNNGFSQDQLQAGYNNLNANQQNAFNSFGNKFTEDEKLWLAQNNYSAQYDPNIKNGKQWTFFQNGQQVDMSNKRFRQFVKNQNIKGDLTSSLPQTGSPVVGGTSTPEGVPLTNTGAGASKFGMSSTALKGMATSIGASLAMAAGSAIISWGVKALSDWYNKADIAAKEAQENAQVLQQQYQETAQTYESFKAGTEAYDNANKGIEGLTKGTVEYREAVMQANEEAMKLLATNADMQYTIDENGIIQINEDDLKKAQEEQFQAMKSAQAASQLASITANEKRMEAEKVKLGRSLDHTDSEEFGMGAGKVGQGVAVGGPSGALIGASIGTMIAPGIGSAIGAALGGLVGMIGGAIKTGTTLAGGNMSSSESKALDKIYKQYKETGNAMFATAEEFKETMSKDLGIDDADLVDTLAENTDTIKEWVRDREQTESYNKEAWIQSFISNMEANDSDWANKSEGEKRYLAESAYKIHDNNETFGNDEIEAYEEKLKSEEELIKATEDYLEDQNPNVTYEVKVEDGKVVATGYDKSGKQIEGEPISYMKDALRKTLVDYQEQLTIGGQLEGTEKQYSQDRAAIYKILGETLNGTELNEKANKVLQAAISGEITFGDEDLLELINQNLEAFSVISPELGELLKKALGKYKNTRETKEEEAQDKVSDDKGFKDEYDKWVEGLTDEDLELVISGAVNFDFATSMADVEDILAAAKRAAEANPVGAKFWDETNLKEGMSAEEYLKYKKDVEEHTGKKFGEEGTPEWEDFVGWSFEAQQAWNEQMKAEEENNEYVILKAEYEDIQRQIRDILKTALPGTEDYDNNMTKLGELEEKAASLEDKLNTGTILQAKKQSEALKSIWNLDLGDTIDPATWANLSDEMKSYFKIMQDGTYQLIKSLDLVQKIDLNNIPDKLRTNSDISKKLVNGDVPLSSFIDNQQDIIGTAEYVQRSAEGRDSYLTWQANAGLGISEISFLPNDKDEISYVGENEIGYGAYQREEDKNSNGLQVGGLYIKDSNGEETKIVADEDTYSPDTGPNGVWWDEDINSLGPLKDELLDDPEIAGALSGQEPDIFKSAIIRGAYNVFAKKVRDIISDTSINIPERREKLKDFVDDVKNNVSINGKKFSDIFIGIPYLESTKDFVDHYLPLSGEDLKDWDPTQYDYNSDTVSTNSQQVIVDGKVKTVDQVENKTLNTLQTTYGLTNEEAQRVLDAENPQQELEKIKFEQNQTTIFNEISKATSFNNLKQWNNNDLAKEYEVGTSGWVEAMFNKGGIYEDFNKDFLETRDLLNQGLLGYDTSEMTEDELTQLAAELTLTSKGLEALNQDLENNYKILTNKGLKGTREYMNALKTLQAELSLVFGGEYVDTTWIEDNLELIYQAIEQGNQAAIDQLLENWSINIAQQLLESAGQFITSDIQNSIIELNNAIKLSQLEIGDIIVQNGKWASSVVKEEIKKLIEDMVAAGVEIATIKDILMRSYGVDVEDLEVDKNGDIDWDKITMKLAKDIPNAISQTLAGLQALKDKTKDTTDYEIKRLDEVVERYKEINQWINKINNSMSLLEGQADRVWGENRLAYLDAEIQGQKQLLKGYEEQAKQAEEYRKTDWQEMQNALGAMGVSTTIEFDEQTGEIANIEDVQRAIDAQYESVYTTANGMSDSEQAEAWKKPFDKGFENWEHYLANYEEATEKIEEYKRQKQEILFKQQDIQMEKFNHAIEVRNAKDEAEMMILDFYLARIDDSLENADQYVGHYLDKGSQLLKQVGEAEQDIQDLIDLHNNPIPEESISDADFVEKYKELIETANSAAEALQQWQEEYWTYLEGLLDKIIEKIDDAKKGVQRLTDITAHYQKIWDLVGDPQDYETKLQLLNATFQLSKANVEESARIVNLWVDNLQRTRAELSSTDEEIRKKAEETINGIEDQVYASIDNMMSAYETALQNAKNQMDTTVEQLQKQLEKSWTGGVGFDWLEKQYQWGKDLAENQELSYDRIYETTKLIRKAQDEINKSTNKTAQLRLKQFQIETKQMQEQSNLTKFQLSMQQKKYDLLLAQIALEDAHNAISDVTLRRDANGNFGYVYTTDQEKISEAEQGVEDAENAIRDAQVEEYNAQISDVLSNLKSFYSDATELQRQLVNKEISQEEYDLKMSELKDYYGEKFKQNAVNIRDAISDWGAGELEAWMPNEEELNTNFDKISKELFGIDDMSQGLANFINSGGQSWFVPLNNKLESTSSGIKGAIGQYEGKAQKMADEINKLSGITFFTPSDLKDYSGTLDQIYGALGNWLKSGDSVEATISNLPDFPSEISAFAKWWTNNGTKFQESFATLFSQIEEYGTDLSSVSTATKNVAEAIKAMKPSNKTTTVTITNKYSGGGGSAEQTPLPPPTDIYLLSHSRSQRGGGKKVEITTAVGTTGVIDNTAESIKAALKFDYNTPDEFVDALKKINWSGKFPVFESTQQTAKVLNYLTSLNRSDVGWIIDQLYNEFNKFDTGGYTGEWGPEGKVAILHEKELVLNADDTKNFLNALSLTDAIMQSLDQATAQFNYQGQIQTASMQPIEKDKLEQSVQIEASFPNVTNHEEIETALNNLVNTAAQYAFAGD